MIYQIVDSPEDPAQKDIFKIAVVNALTNTLIDINDNITQIDYCEGIPFTVEILAQFGFRAEGDEHVTWQVLDNEIVNFVAENKNGVIEVYLDGLPEVRITQLHQLQNLYIDLIKKEIKLLQVPEK